MEKQEGLLERQNSEYARHSDRILVELLKTIIAVSGIALAIVFGSITSQRYIPSIWDGISTTLFLIAIISSIVAIGELQGIVWKHAQKLEEKQKTQKELVGSKKGLEIAGWISYVSAGMAFIVLIIRVWFLVINR